MKRRFNEIKPLMIVTAILALLLLGCAWALAEEDGIRMEAQVGYDGTVLCGRWIPLRMELIAGDAPYEGQVCVDIGVKHAYYDRLCLPVSLDAGETKMVSLPLRPLVEQDSFSVTLESEGVIDAQSTAMAQMLVPEDALVIGVASGQLELCEALSAIEERSIHGELEVICAIPLSEESFPNERCELEAFDALVIGATPAGDERIRENIAAWQKKGGVLIERNMAQEDAALTAQAIFDEIKAQQIEHGTMQRESYNYAYGEGLNSSLRVNRGEGILPAVLLLTAYALLAGGGLYLLMKRLDRSKDLWIAIPAACAVLCVLMAAMGAKMTLNKPVSVSAHVTHIDREGGVQAQELALINIPSQERVTVTTKDGCPVSRMEYAGFSSWVKMDEGEMALRDVIVQGDAPSLELIGQATWKKRALLIGHDAAPKGEIVASAHMEEDGLHIAVENQTDQLIRDAVLLTELGFARVGDLAAGGKTEILLARTDETKEDKDGMQLLEEGVMAAYQESMHRVMDFCVDPEMAYDAQFRRSSLDEAEQSRRIDLANRLSLAGHALSGTELDCVLIGETPEIVCQQLLLDGKPVERQEQVSMLLLEIPFETQSPDGHFYHPQQRFIRMEAAMGADGRPVLGAKKSASYAEQKEEVLFGFALDGVQAASVERLYVASTPYVGRDAELTLAYYDHQKGVWTALERADRATLEGEMARAAISGQGEVFFRYTGKELMENGVRLPEIAVEGKNMSDTATDETMIGDNGGESQ